MFRFGTTLVKHNIYKHASFQAFSFSSMNGEWGFPLPVMFGNGRIQELPAILESISSTRPLIVTDRDLVANTNIIKDVESILSVATYGECLKRLHNLKLLGMIDKLSIEKNRR